MPDNFLSKALEENMIPTKGYTDVQFIALTLSTRQHDEGMPGERYVGTRESNNHHFAKDIRQKVDVMRLALERATKDVDLDSRDSTLKVFMAPEFMFRPINGAYQPEDAFGEGVLVQQLCMLIKEKKWRNWLCVFGSMIIAEDLDASIAGRRLKSTETESRQSTMLREGSEVLVDPDLAAEAIADNTHRSPSINEGGNMHVIDAVNQAEGNGGQLAPALKVHSGCADDDDVECSNPTHRLLEENVVLIQKGGFESAEEALRKSVVSVKRIIAPEDFNMYFTAENDWGGAKLLKRGVGLNREGLGAEVNNVVNFEGSGEQNWFSSYQVKPAQVVEKWANTYKNLIVPFPRNEQKAPPLILSDDDGNTHDTTRDGDGAAGAATGTSAQTTQELDQTTADTKSSSTASTAATASPTSTSTSTKFSHTVDDIISAFSPDNNNTSKTHTQTQTQTHQGGQAVAAIENADGSSTFSMDRKHLEGQLAGLATAAATAALASNSSTGATAKTTKTSTDKKTTKTSTTKTKTNSTTTTTTPSTSTPISSTTSPTTAAATKPPTTSGTDANGDGDDDLPTEKKYNEIRVADSSVFDVDGIRFGLEICIEHFGPVRILRREDVQEVDIHLVPSGGLTAQFESLVTQAGGYVFNVDGSLFDLNFHFEDVNTPVVGHVVHQGSHAEVWRVPMGLDERIRLMEEYQWKEEEESPNAMDRNSWAMKRFCEWVGLPRGRRGWAKLFENSNWRDLLQDLYVTRDKHSGLVIRPDTQFCTSCDPDLPMVRVYPTQRLPERVLTPPESALAGDGHIDSIGFRAPDLPQHVGPNDRS
jgi:hypothetical protein